MKIRRTLSPLFPVIGLTLCGFASESSRVLDDLASDVVVVLDLSGNPRVELVETDHGVANMRILAIGDDYADGWKILAVTPGSVTLQRGQAIQVVLLTGRSSPTAATPATAPVAVAIGAGNGGIDGTGLSRSATVAAAITAGDTRRVLQLGGTPRQAYMAFQGRQGLAVDDTDLNSIRLVKMEGGDVTLAFRTTAGLSGTLPPGALYGYAPPGGIDSLPTLQQAFGAR